MGEKRCVLNGFRIAKEVIIVGVASVKWSAGIGSNTASANNSAVSVKVTKVSARDTAYFSAQARTAAQTAAEKTEQAAAAESGEQQKSLSDIIKEQTEKIDSMFSSSKDYDKSKDRVLLLIKQKMRGGLMLSASEEKYLSKNDPDSYSNYRTVVDARRSFRSQLAMCRNKDDVISMRLCNALSALSAYKKAIKQGGDGAEVAGLNMALEREISSFSRSARYQSLPTSAERSRYQIELAKARRYEREKRLADRMNTLRKKKKQVKTPGDGKRTVAQVENSYLGRKIRNADRGCGGGVSFPSFGSTYRGMNQRG